MTRIVSTSVLTAFLALATFSAASAEARDPNEVAGYNAAIASVRNPVAPAAAAPVVEGRNTALVSVTSSVGANAERAISQAVRQFRD